MTDPAAHITNEEYVTPKMLRKQFILQNITSHLHVKNYDKMRRRYPL